MSFVHLHVHSEYSLLDGVNRTKGIVKAAKEMEMPAIALTDHGVMYGAAEFWKAAKGEGVKPIIGCEIYLSPGDHKERQEVNGLKYYHLLLLAKNLKGYQNLSKIVTIGQLEGMYYRPRVSLEILAQYSEGLICTSACAAGPLARHIARGETAIAEDWLQKLANIFPDSFYLELQRNGFSGEDKLTDEIAANYDQETIEHLHEQIKINKELRKLSQKYNLPLVASSDAHYLKKQDSEIQEILFCIKDGMRLDEPGHRKGYLDTYIKSPDEMRADYADDPTPVENTLKIAEEIEAYDLKFKRVQPKFWNVPEGKTAKELLHEEVWKRAPEKYGELSHAVKQRLEYELHVIGTRGYDDYFLIVGDIMQFARSQGIVVNVRGSAAGSMVAYVLGITNVEPVKWDLVFERFLNLERPSPPDIDMDFQDDRRNEVIAYVEEKYGHDRVAAIGTLGTLGTKAAIRDVARVMGIDLSTADKLSKMVITVFGKNYNIDKMIAEVPEFAEIINSDPQLQQLAENVKKIDGIARHISMHPCGHLITPEPLTNYLALQRESRGGDKIITQFDGDWIDKLDFMKFDFLGLRNLTIIKNTQDLIEKYYGIKLTTNDIPHDDKKTFELLSRGETTAVFQLESPPMQKYLKELQPETLEDICFMLAAYRPGPMQYIPGYIACKNGKQQPEYIIPELKEITGVTYGYPIYQEQLLSICMKISQMTLGEGDVLRNAFKKKQVEILTGIEPKFKEGVTNRGHSKEVADKLWDALLPFADYGFNKAHSASYAMVSYWSAYLKANYPLIFMAALLHSDLDDSERIAIDLKEAKRMGYKIAPPDINKSGAEFTIEGEDTIRVGLAAIKNVGVKVCEKIVELREQDGEFTSLDDLVVRLGAEYSNKRSLECLIKVGALDAFGPRNGLLAVLPSITDKHLKAPKKVAPTTQTTMFSMMTAIPETPQTLRAEATILPLLDPIPDVQKVQWEKELIGIVLQTNPLEAYALHAIKEKCLDLSAVAEAKEGAKVKVMAILDGSKMIRTKKANKPMSFLTLSDLISTLEAVLFPEVHAKFYEHLQEGQVYIFTGTINFRNDKCTMLVDNISQPDPLMQPQLTINICGLKDTARLQTLKECFTEQGELEVKILYGDQKEPKLMVKQMANRPECVEVIKEYMVSL